MAIIIYQYMTSLYIETEKSTTALNVHYNTELNIIKHKNSDLNVLVLNDIYSYIYIYKYMQRIEYTDSDDNYKLLHLIVALLTAL